MAEFRILDFNYAQKDNVDLSGSSEDVSFPASNIGHEFRSKVWRSSGYFVIGTTNNKIDFKETGPGAEITATLTSGSYSVSELITEIKTQLEAESLNTRTYTITHSSSTGKWTITGSGTFDLLNSSGTNVANSLLANSLGYAAVDTGFIMFHTGSGIALHTEEWMQVDLKTAEEIDSVALVFDPRRGVRLTSGAVVKVQASATPAFVTPAVDVTLTIDSEFSVATHFFTAVQEYRFWRINIVDPGNPDLFVELGTIILSKATKLTQNPEIGFTFSLTDQSKVQTTSFGNEYADIFPKRATLAFNYKALSDADTLTLEKIYRDVGMTVPIAMAFNSDETLFDKDRFFIYGKLSGGFTESNVFLNFFDTNLQLRETF